MNSDMRILRGLSIATMVFSILGVLAGGAFLALMISASSMLSDPAFFDLLFKNFSRALLVPQRLMEVLLRQRMTIPQ